MKNRVLVVDDTPAMLRLFEHLFKKMGCAVVCAASSEEAMECASQGFDWILSDIQMPGKDGIWLACWLRQRYPHLRIALMTAYPTREYIEETKEKNLPLLQKPFEIEELLGIFGAPPGTMPSVA